MRDVKLSIIVPVYNVEKYLYECIDSIISQNLNNCEVIFVDDGSSDNSGTICDDYCKRYDCFSVIHKENGGLSDARNIGIKAARGEYLLFLDSDDKLSSDAIAVILKEIKKRHTDIIVGRAVTFSDICEKQETYNIHSYQPYMSINTPSKLLLKLDRNSDFWFAAWLVVIRREFLYENELYFTKGLFHEDELWVPIVFLNARTASLIDTPFYMYRVNRAGSIVSSQKIKREFDKITIAKHFKEFVSVDRYGKILLKRRSAALIYGVVLSLMKYIDDEEYHALLEEVKRNNRLLMFGKYMPIYILNAVIGPEATSKVLNHARENK